LRNQRGVKYALDDFIRIRLGSLDSFAGQARRVKAQNPQFYTSLEQVYGVPAGILLAIHGMETGFGRNLGWLMRAVLRQISAVQHMVRWGTHSFCPAMH